MSEQTLKSSPPNRFQQELKPLASLKLTAVLLALLMLLVFVGTSIQKEMGVWDVQRLYFHSFVVWVDFRLLFPLWTWGYSHIPGSFPMLGGFSIIALLLVNLIAAFLVRFKFTSNRIGILTIHFGLILMVLGEVITTLVARESQMVIDEGQSVQYTQSTRDVELALIDPSPTDHDEVVSISSGRLAKQDVISYPTLPFSIRVDQYYNNSIAMGPFQARQAPAAPRQREINTPDSDMVIREVAKANGVDTNSVDVPSAQISLMVDNKVVATFPVTVYVDRPEVITVDNHQYLIQLRWRRFYKPYTMSLVKFSHDVYTGTADPANGNMGMARNFASLIHLTDPTTGEDREVKIWMNHPLRYNGDTFYQASFKPGDKTTILQVVNNPGWLIPYISLTLVALGMVIHLGAKLLTFLKRTRNPGPIAKSKKSKTDDQPRAGLLWPIVATIICAAFLFNAARPKESSSGFDFVKFGKVPINYEGRVMPMDTLARISLRILSGKSEAKTDDGRSIPAIEWLADVVGTPQKANQYKTFRIDHPDVLNLLSLDTNQTRFSFDQIMASSAKIDEQYSSIMKIDSKLRDTYQNKLVELADHLQLYIQLVEGHDLYIAPPAAAGEDWHKFRQAEEAAKAGGKPNPGLSAYASMAIAHSNSDSASFNAAADGYLRWLDSNLPEVSKKTSFETWFNYLDPFYNSIVLYVIIFIMICISWLINPMRSALQRSAFWILVMTFVFHTFGLAARIYISERPPVTNLYSSAIFIGWGAVLFCIFIEKLYHNGIGSLAASIVAFPALVIAHYLAGSGDTMHMLQAVLDTNLWLATHVVVVTLGYTASFLAGMIACIYVIGHFLLSITGAYGVTIDNMRKSFAKMTYGIICFAVLFSFVGTVLGGIWADQSWGRFWGWDPKENGAVLIVLWNALVLHARFGGLVRERGMMLMAIFGNIVTAWSWFGTNMMGVGLHSYGFMDSAVTWLGLFVLSQIFLIGIGMMQNDQSKPITVGKAVTN